MLIVTDAQTDVDDVGAITVAANSGQRVYGLVSSSRRPSVAQTLQVLDRHYEMGARIGLDKAGELISDRDFYSSTLPREFPTGPSRVVGAGRAMRQALRDAYRDGERIPVISIGSLGTLSRFLNPARPKARERNHRLIRDAVSGLFVMAGDFESGSSEFNVRLNPTAAQAVAREWPTGITFAGFELGRDLLTGSVLAESTGPSRRAYQLFPRRGVIEDKPSYDQVAVAAALKAPGLVASARGRVGFLPDGRTQYSRGGGNRRFLKFESLPRLRRWINKRLY